MINIDNISFAYKEKPVLHNFSLIINKSDHICLFGKSGCGKTTLLRIICGLEHPQSGKIFGSENIKPSYVFQENRLLPFKTVLKNILLTGADEKTANENLKALRIENTSSLYPSDLSGGMKRRVAIARALSAEFDYLILDEAFTGLDEKNIEIAAKRILYVCKDRPIIMVTHSKAEADLLNAKIINM